MPRPVSSYYPRLYNSFSVQLLERIIRNSFKSNIVGCQSEYILRQIKLESPIQQVAEQFSEIKLKCPIFGKQKKHTPAPVPLLYIQINYYISTARERGLSAFETSGFVPSMFYTSKIHPDPSPTPSRLHFCCLRLWSSSSISSINSFFLPDINPTHSQSKNKGPHRRTSTQKENIVECKVIGF